MMETYTITLYEGEYPRKENLPLPDNIFEALRIYLVENDFLRKKGEGGLRFVGTFHIKTKEYCLRVCALPKYLNCGERLDYSTACNTMITIRRVIEKSNHLFNYDVSEAEFDPYRRQTKYNTVSRYDLAKWLVSDYEKNGIFAVRERRQTRSNRGRIAWNRTILKTTPVIDEDEVAYLAPISVYVSQNDKLLLSDIHRCAVKEAMEDLGEEASMTIEPLYREELRGHLDQFASVIRNYQRLVFTERDIMLLRYLEAWCLHESAYYNRPVGTVSFELVWEDVLRGVFGHKGLDGKVGFGAPVYHIGGKKYELDGDSIPDVMNFWKADEKTRFLLVDGKYYLGSVEGNKVKNLPGYKDIAKQIDYYETLCKVYGLNVDCGQNVFVQPRWDALCRKDFSEQDGLALRYVGYVRKPGKNPVIGKIVGDFTTEKPQMDKVHLVQMEPEKLYRLFLSGVSAPEKYADILWEYISTNSCGEKDDDTNDVHRTDEKGD